MKVTVLGEGAWGSALATLLVRNSHDVTLWCHDKELCKTLGATHANARYLPGYKLPAQLQFTDNLQEALAAPYIIVTTPVAFLRRVLQEAQAFITPEQTWIFGCKGIEFESFQFSYQIFTEISGNNNFALISGPSFAQEVMLEKPTAVMLAASPTQDLKVMSSIFASPTFNLEFTQDLTGVAAAGAYKNIAALACGLVAGYTHSENTRAWVITRALEELKIFIEAMDGDSSTTYSLAGIGDLVLTCYSTTSKNFRYGCARGSGKKLEEINQQFPTIPEGPNTLKALYNFQKKHALKLELSSLLYEIFFESKSPELLLEKSP